MSSASCPSYLVEFPFDVRVFCSVASETPPTDAFLHFLGRETKVAALRFCDVTISRETYANLREATKGWLRRGHAGDLDALTVPGISAPLISSRVPTGCAIVCRALDSGGAR